MSLNIRKLSSGLEKIAKEKYLENESELPAKLDALRKWLKEQPNLKTPLGMIHFYSFFIKFCIKKKIYIFAEDQFLITFLRCNYHNVENAQDMIKHFFIARIQLPKLYANRDPLDKKNDELLRLG